LQDVIVDKALDFINKNTKYDENELKKIRYGLEGIYLTITKIIIVLVIGVIFHTLDSVLLTLLFFNILRFFAFGLHAKKSYQCLILSIIQFNILPLLFNYLFNNTLAIYIVFVIALFSFILFAPSDTVKRPLRNKKKRIIRKILVIITSFIYIYVAFNFINIRSAILSSLIIESFMINPLSYKLLGLPYNNYKKC
jgi:accessory gene regulator B